MKQVFDELSLKVSRLTTKRYSTSFSMGIRFFHRELRNPIYAIYGFVRLADEIVDSFHAYDKRNLFYKFRQDTYDALHEKISLNPILNSFQNCVHQFNIPLVLIDKFMDSMEMDLTQIDYSVTGYQQYIHGSAEVVGLMCLKIFCQGDDQRYEALKYNAIKLGAAYQKVNFLRDLKEDFHHLGRNYFPGLTLDTLTHTQKQKIEQEIESDFREGLAGIMKLPKSSRLGVYLSYVYFHSLLNKIKKTRPEKLLQTRIRVSNSKKYLYTLHSLVKLKAISVR